MPINGLMAIRNKRDKCVSPFFFFTPLVLYILRAALIELFCVCARVWLTAWEMSGWNLYI